MVTFYIKILQNRVFLLLIINSRSDEDHQGSKGMDCELSEYAAGTMHSLFFLHHHAPALHFIQKVVLRLLYYIILLPTFNQVDRGDGLSFGNRITESYLPSLSVTCAY